MFNATKSNVHWSTIYNRTRKQPKYPSTNECIKKMWSRYAVQYYSAIKRKEVGLFAVIWMDLESVIQSEVSQKEGK